MKWLGDVPLFDKKGFLIIPVGLTMVATAYLSRRFRFGWLLRFLALNAIYCVIIGIMPDFMKADCLNDPAMRLRVKHFGLVGLVWLGPLMCGTLWLYLSELAPELGLPRVNPLLRERRVTLLNTVTAIVVGSVAVFVAFRLYGLAAYNERRANCRSSSLTSNVDSTPTSRPFLPVSDPHFDFPMRVSPKSNFLAIIDYDENNEGQNDKIIRELEGFIKDHPDDPSVGSMLCLLGDTYRKKSDDSAALDALKRAMWSDSPDDVIGYGLDSATELLQGMRDWTAIAELYVEFLRRKPESPSALHPATWLAKMLSREHQGVPRMPAVRTPFFPGSDAHFRFVMRASPKSNFLAIIDYDDKDQNQTNKIIRDIEGFLRDHPDDIAAGSMFCLLADTYMKKNDDSAALDALKRAVSSESPDDVIEYGLNSASEILQLRRDWSALLELQTNFLQRRRESPVALLSATWAVKALIRGRHDEQATKILSEFLKKRMGNPPNQD